MADLTLEALFARAAEQVGHTPMCEAGHSADMDCRCWRDRERRLLALCARMAEVYKMDPQAGAYAAARVLEESDG